MQVADFVRGCGRIRNVDLLEQHFEKPGHLMNCFLLTFLCLIGPFCAHSIALLRLMLSVSDPHQLWARCLHHHETCKMSTPHLPTAIFEIFSSEDCL